MGVYRFLWCMLAPCVTLVYAGGAGATPMERFMNTIGPQHTRKTIRAMTDRALAKIDGMPTKDGVEVLGCGIDDVGNMRSNKSLMSTAIFLKLVRVGRFSPKSIIVGPTLRKVPKGSSIRGSKQSQVDARVRRIARSMPGPKFAELAGLSPAVGYGLRYDDGHISLQTLLGLIQGGGWSIDEVVFGRKR